MPNEPAPRRPWSLALRTTGIVAVAMAALLAAFAWQIGRSLEAHFEEQDLGELRVVAQSLFSALAHRESADDRADLERRLSRAVRGHHGVFFEVRDNDGQRIYGTAPPGLADAARGLPPTASLDAADLRVWRLDEGTFRGAVLQLGGYRALVAVMIDFHLHYLARLHKILWLGTLAAIGAAILAAWLAVSWGLAPLRRIGERMGEVGAGQLHLRLAAAQVPRELEHLVASFNAMLDRLQESFTRLSDFSADIAHELRTPVTNLTTQAQVALARARTVEDYQELLYSSLEELERMGKTIADMLYLAQADHQLHKPELADVELGAQVRELFDYFEALAEDRGIALRLEGGAVSARVDRLMLRRALSNLISNGLRYATRGQALTVRVARRGPLAIIEIENLGPDIAPEHLSRLFDRFYRVDPARQHKGDGAGLGLAIVKSIVQAHGGEAHVRSALGKTCFTISLMAGGAPLTNAT